MATSVSYTGDGVTTNYSFPFTYLSPDYIKASINNVETLDFTLFNPTTVSFNSAPADGAAIRIFRETPTDNLLAEANPGSALRAQDLELNARQNLNVVQELETFVNNQSSAGLQAQVDAATLTANNALITANSAVVTADDAETTALGIAATASAAVVTANAAQDTADAAVVTANAAVVTANAAQDTADDALALISNATASGRNLIQNGAFSVNDIHGLTPETSVSSKPFAANRWLLDSVTGGLITTQTFTTGGPSISLPGFQRLTVGTVDASLAAGDFYSLYQVVEGFNARRLGLGTANAVPFMLSFRVRSSTTGTYTACIQSADKGRSYLSTFSIGVANTWETKQISVPAITSGSWNVDNTRGLQLRFTLAAGTTFQGTNNTWNTSDRRGVSGQTNFMATAGRTFDITGIQLEAGTTATEFELIDHPLIVQQCLRYYNKVDGPITFGQQKIPPLNSAGQIWFPTTMRIPPVVFNTTPTYTDASGLTFPSVTEKFAYLNINVTGSNPSVTFPSGGFVSFNADYSP